MRLFGAMKAVQDSRRSGGIEGRKMRSPDAAIRASKLLILLAVGAAFCVSASEGAPRCPSGQILRVSKGVCVPKAENLALISKPAAKPKPVGQAMETQQEEDAPAAPAQTPKPTWDRVADPARPERSP